MSNLIVLSMKTHKLLGRFAEDAAAEACHTANPPAHTVAEGDLSALSSADLVKVFNACEGVTPIKRFSDRRVAERRVLEVLSGAVVVVAVGESPGLATTAAVSVAETALNGAADAEPAKMVVAAIATAAKTDGGEETYILTAAGGKDSLRFQSGSARFVVFSAVKAAGKNGMRLSALCGALGPLTRAQIRGCLDKLRALEYINIKEQH